MPTTKRPLAMVRALGVAIVASAGLAGCATYDDEFATINSRLDQLDTRVQGAAQSAESANQSARIGPLHDVGIEQFSLTGMCLILITVSLFIKGT